ncbi:MAG TPA: SIS domain-containing protein [Gemmatimonadales bacterium]
MDPARVEAGLDALARTAEAAKVLSPQVAGVAGRFAAVLRAGGTLFFCGNGGSAADAQHLATEYVVRYAARRRPLAAVALTTDTSLLTAAGNDLGFEQIFARQVEALCRPADLLVLHSTSGRSPNLLAAARSARARGVATVAFLGESGGPLAAEVDEAVLVPAAESGQIQVLHLALEHLIVELVEAELSRDR